MSAPVSNRPRALLSVYNKTNIVEFATELSNLGYELVSTGGTARKLREAGLEVIGVSDVTGHPKFSTVELNHYTQQSTDPAC